MQQDLYDIVKELADSEPIYTDAEEGTFCVHCNEFARVRNEGGHLTNNVYHTHDCLYQRARVIIYGG